MTLIDDVGVINNYGVVDMQMYGGLAQGIGLALQEDFEDPAKYNNLITCGFPYIKDITDDMELIHMETPREFGPYGASELITSAHLSKRTHAAPSITLAAPESRRPDKGKGSGVTERKAPIRLQAVFLTKTVEFFLYL